MDFVSVLACVKEGKEKGEWKGLSAGEEREKKKNREKKRNESHMRGCYIAQLTWT